MNALDHLLADISATHKGHKLPRRAAPCPQGQPARLRQAKRPTAAKPAPAPKVTPAAPTPDESPAIARALATLRAELGKVAS